MKSLSILSFLFFLILLFPATGCAPKGPVGSWKVDREAQRLFKTGVPLENHTYYYTGPRVLPNAVIALHNSYTLRSRFWVKIDITQSILENWLFIFRTNYSLRCRYQGGYIKTPDNRIAGVWYSKRVINIVREPEPGVLEIYLPRFIPYSPCDRERILDDL